MRLLNLISSFAFTTVFASDCNNPANFPSSLKVGLSFDLVTQSATSPDNSLTTAITGKILILGPCQLQLVGLTLANAPITAGLQLYGQSATQSFPISSTTLSGSFSNQPGPVFTFSDTTVFQISPQSPGIAWSDFTSIRVFSVPQKWIVAEALITSGTPYIASNTVKVNAPAATATSPAQVPTKPLSAKSSSITIAILGSTLIFAVIMSYII